MANVAMRPQLIHAIAICADCKWEEMYFTKAVKAAAKHHRETGHQIDVETGYHKLIKRKK